MAGAALAILDGRMEPLLFDDGLVAGSTELELISLQQGWLVGGMGRVAQRALAFLHGEMRNDR